MVEAPPIRYFDRAGDPITYKHWQTLRNNDEYVCVVDSKIPEKDVEVKTSWIGQDVADTKPLIFQTVVYMPSDGPGPSMGKLGGMRYATEAEARKGHKKVMDAVLLLHDHNPPPFTTGVDFFDGRGED